MTTENDLISVIIPLFNSERYLAAAIESVLNQSYQPTEIIVVNDGSTDGSEEVAERFLASIRYDKQPNGGAGAARNRGIELAQGRYFAFLDADDIWVADKLERQMAQFDHDPDLDMVFGYVQQFITPDLDVKLQSKITHRGEVMKGIIAGAMLIKRDSFFQAGLFDTDRHLGEFIDWYLRAKEQQLKSAMLEKIVMKRRLHDTNMGIRECEHRSDYVHVLKAALDRRRGLAS